jgi:eukaryotic-like serine/threonine-protein kinase
MIGATLGRFHVLERLGAGGMGEVYLAEDPVLGRRLAVKVLAPEFARDPERRERLLHEARAASALNHPNIVVVHDLGETDGTLWVAMERIEGETLRSWGTPRRPAGEIVMMMRQAAAALDAAHGAGLVHRDLKPENMMVRSDGILKILDFGLARSVSPGTLSKTATMPGLILGTAPYMSPEQVLGQPAGPPSDLFSMGTILYELLTGTHPFVAGSAVETMHRILHDSPDLPSAVNPALTPDFDFVMNKLLAKEPPRRQASAHDLDVDLETLECACLASPAARAAAGDGKGNGPRAIAVLPFKNIGGDRELAYLGIGLADAVITRLSSSPDLVVRATSSIARYDGQPVDPRHVGQELDVSAVLDASYQRLGERFRATARLVETPGGRALWAGKVDVRFDDIFEVQDQVAQGIAEALAATIAVPTKAKPFTPDPRAYELILRAVKARDAATEEAFREGLAYAEQAIAIQPDYAVGWASVGGFCHGMVDGGFDSDPAWLERAEKALRRALELDPREPVALFNFGAYTLTLGRKREAWEALLGSARLAPNNPMVYHYFAYLFRLASMLDEALEVDRHGMEIDPSNPWLRFGVIRGLVILGRTDEARAEIERARSRLPGHPRLLAYGADCAAVDGAYEEALAIVAGLKGRDCSFTERLQESLFLALLGRTADARAAASGAEGAARIDMDHAATYAAILAHAGEVDRAFEFLARAVELGNDCLPYYRRNDLYAPLHADRRWKPFLEGVERRVAEWRTIFRWPLPAA